MAYHHVPRLALPTRGEGAIGQPAHDCTASTFQAPAIRTSGFRTRDNRVKSHVIHDASFVADLALHADIFHAGNSFSNSCASWRSVFCFFARFALISAGSPIHTSKPNSASSRSNQQEYPVASIPLARGLLAAAGLDRISRPLYAESPDGMVNLQTGSVHYTTLTEAIDGLVRADPIPSRERAQAKHAHARKSAKNPA
jgi:hypothetical protein